MISLYTDVRLSSGSSDALPSMPMFEYELLPSIQALEVIEQSLQSYLTNAATNFTDRDSALDTYSETSSSIEPIISSTDALSLRPEQRSSSSSSEKKTIVSSSSSSAAAAALPQDDEVSVLTFQIERQVSDEGYRSVRNGQQQSHETTSLLESYALTEKIDQWLSNTNAEGSRSEPTNDYAQSIHPTEDFRVKNDSNAKRRE